MFFLIIQSISESTAADIISPIRTCGSDPDMCKTQKHPWDWAQRTSWTQLLQLQADKSPIWDPPWITPLTSPWLFTTEPPKELLTEPSSEPPTETLSEPCRDGTALSTNTVHKSKNKRLKNKNKITKFYFYYSQFLALVSNFLFSF